MLKRSLILKHILTLKCSKALKYSTDLSEILSIGHKLSYIANVGEIQVMLDVVYYLVTLPGLYIMLVGLHCLTLAHPYKIELTKPSYNHVPIFLTLCNLINLQDLLGTTVARMGSVGTTTVSRGTGKGKPTVSDTFRHQLQALVDVLQSTNPW